MTFSYSKLSATIIAFLCISACSILYAEDVSVEPGVVELGEPKYHAAPQQAQEIQAAIQQIKDDIQNIQQNTNNELVAMQQEINTLKETPGNKSQIKAIKEQMQTLKRKTNNQIKILQNKVKQLEHQAKHKFNVRHEKY
jgi:uncharacterized protein Yka (UPF0111/DUF47 family)